MENYDKNNFTNNENNVPEKEERDFFERTSHYDPLAKKNDEKREAFEENEKISAGIKIKSPFLAKLENFFYHYKWHTIIGLFLVFVVGLCIFQTCKRTNYDAYIMYAGGHDLRIKEAEQAERTYEILYKSCESYLGDYNEDGERNLSFIDMYIPSPDEIKELEKGDGVPYNRLKEDDELFRNNILSGDYYVCMISKYLFDEWTKDENNPFVPVASYLPEGAKIAENENDAGYRLASEYGVYLSSTPVKDKAGFELLPNDTVLCLRKYSKASSPGKKGKKVYENCEKLFTAILKGETYE